MENLKTTKFKKHALAARIMGAELTPEQKMFWKTKQGVVNVVINSPVTIGTNK